MMPTAKFLRIKPYKNTVEYVRGYWAHTCEKKRGRVAQRTLWVGLDGNYHDFHLQIGACTCIADVPLDEWQRWRNVYTLYHRMIK